MVAVGMDIMVKCGNQYRAVIKLFWALLFSTLVANLLLYGTYLMGRCSSSNFLGDWYEQYCSPTSVDFLFLPSLLLSFMTFTLLSQRKLGTPRNFFKMWYPDRARPRSAQILLVSVSEGVPRTTSPRQVSTFPPPLHTACAREIWIDQSGFSRWEKNSVSSRQCKLTGKALKSSNFSHWRLH